jgi:hypothetical protein
MPTSAHAPSVTRGGAAQCCTQCEAPLAGRYCGQCGLRRFERHDLSLGHYAHEAFHELFHLDGRLWRTLRLLLTRPGQLTLDAVTGRGALAISPLRLFLVMSAVFFFLGQASFLKLETVLGYAVRGSAAERTAAVERRLEEIAVRRGEPVALVKEHLEHRFEVDNKLAQVATVALFVAVLALLFAGSGHYFVEHLLFGLHYYSFRFLLSVVMQPLALVLNAPWQLSFALGTLVLTAYLALALRRVYASGALATALRTLVLVIMGAALNWVSIYVAVRSVTH